MGENGLPLYKNFEQFDTEDGRVYQICKVEVPKIFVMHMPLLDDPDFRFLAIATADYKPPVFSAACQQTSSHPQQCPLDIHDEYCGKFTKHRKYNCWEAQPWGKIAIPMKSEA